MTSAAGVVSVACWETCDLQTYVIYATSDGTISIMDTSAVEGWGGGY